jgi:arylsulfatase A-like enzyme
MTRPKSNLLFVFADQLRACSLGYAGEEAVRTPNIDAFAETGTVYSNGVSMLPVCGPYRGSLITGRTPTSTGLVINDIPLKTSEISIGRLRHGLYWQVAPGRPGSPGPGATRAAAPGLRLLDGCQL